jgi:serine/threonine protein phosphatase PrpC
LKTNQDSYIAAPNILQLKYFHYFGVADGHGEWGHLVSNLIKQKMPETLQSELNINFKAYHLELQK